MFWQFVIFAVGLAILYCGAEGLLKGAVALARACGISPLMIGMTIVGFGTSAPELAVNLSAALRDTAGIALGNVVGSNIANIGLILGLAAVIRPLNVQMRLLRIEFPIMLTTAVILWFMALNGVISRLEGGMLLAAFLVLAVYVLMSARREPPHVQQEVSSLAGEKPRILWGLLLVVVGLAGLMVGAELMVRSASALAHEWGMSDVAIGLTIVAIGTSLPELASSIVAARRGEPDIAVGNVIGSNIFNIVLILGATAVVRPLEVEAQLASREIPVMLGFTLALLPILRWGMKVSRLEGMILLAGFLAFLVWQVLLATS